MIMDEEIKKQLEEIAKRVFLEQSKSAAFTDRKLTDTPNDALSVVNRRFVTLSSNLAARPVSSVALVGQRFFDTTNNVPIWFTVDGWRNATSSIVAGHI